MTGAFALSDEEIYDSYQDAVKSGNQENMNKRYGVGILAYWAGILVVKVLHHFFCLWFPKSWMRFQNTTPIRRLRSATGTHPAVTPKVGVVFVFIILAIVFSFIQLSVWYPSATNNYLDAATFGRALGNRVGMMSLYLLPLLILFAGRNNFLLWITGLSQDTFVFFHRWIARVMVLLLLAHGIAESIARASRGIYSEMFGIPFWSYGIVGLSFAMFIFVQGMRFIRGRAYDLFIVLHIVAVIIFLAAGYWHLKDFTTGLSKFFYACFAVWGADRLARLLRVLYSSRIIGRPALIELEHRTLVITFDHPWPVTAGQFVYIHFLVGHVWWQSHPFTLVPSSQEPGKLKIYVRIHRGITKRLSDLVLKKNEVDAYVKEGLEEKDSYKIETKVLLDGPYGHSYNFAAYEELVFVAGGTGITSPHAYIRQYLDKKITLFWAVGTSHEKWFDEELESLAEFKHIEVHVIFTKEQKLNIPEVLGTRLEQINGPTAVLCCGPTSMNNDTRATVASLVPKVPHYLQFYAESFSL